MEGLHPSVTARSADSCTPVFLSLTLSVSIQKISLSLFFISFFPYCLNFTLRVYETQNKLSTGAAHGLLSDDFMGSNCYGYNGQAGLRTAFDGDFHR